MQLDRANEPSAQTVQMDRETGQERKSAVTFAGGYSRTCSRRSMFCLKVIPEASSFLLKDRERSLKIGRMGNFVRVLLQRQHRELGRQQTENRANYSHLLFAWEAHCREEG